MLKVKESPLLSGMFFIVDEDGEVYDGPFMTKDEADEKLKELDCD